MADTTPIELPEGYYLDNFKRLLSSVKQYQHHLFEDWELQVLEQFDQLPLDAARLYVRLISRKGPLFRQDKLKYAEIEQLDQQVVHLQTAGFVQVNPPIHGQLLLPFLIKKELLGLHRQLLPQTPTSSLDRLALTQALQEIDKSVLSQAIYQQYRLLQPSHLDLIERCQLAFFGNQHQSLTDFVLADIGQLTYEDYPISPEHSPFSCPSELRHKQHYAALEQQWQQLPLADVEALDQFQQQLPERSDTPSLRRSHQRLLLRLARQYERLQAHNKALAVYQQVDQPPSRERQVRILATQIPERAAQLLRQIAHEPMDDSERDFASVFAKKLAKQGHYPHPPHIAKQRINNEQLVLSKSDQRVELAAAQYYQQQGYEVFYLENHWLLGIFGLFFWDIIFADVDGAFINPFQLAPLDLYHNDFYRKRQNQFEQRLRELDDPQLWQQRLQQTWQQKHNIANRFVYWPLWSEALLQLTIERVSIQPRKQLLQALLQDLPQRRRGFPDLVLFEQQDFELVEVKGPGDRLQPQQKQWFQRFEDLGINARTAQVSWLDDSNR